MDKKNILIVCIITVVLIIILIARSIFISRMEKARDKAIAKACGATIRVITGGVEMYNMDNKIMMKDLDIKALSTPTYNSYTKKNEVYLKGDPNNNAYGCSYKSNGDLTEYGEIICNKHGSLKDIERNYGR